MKKLITAAACLLMSSCASAQQVSKKDLDECYLIADAFRGIALAYSRGTSKIELVKMFDGNPESVELVLVVTEAVDLGSTPKKISDKAFVACVEDAMKKTTNI